jgi:hypothetical protein
VAAVLAKFEPLSAICLHGLYAFQQRPGQRRAFLHLLLPAHLPRTKEDHQRLACPESCRLDIHRPFT